MLKPYAFIAAVAGMLYCSSASAQTDTTELNLGRISLKKDFTQHVTVKGEDLQRMPYTNLAEALNVWFYGSYTDASSLVYVIDGNLVNDVNTYSVFDIDEATLVQNAISTLNGKTGVQQLVIIKTKRGSTKGTGVVVSSQLSASTLHKSANETAGAHHTTTLYQQYYAGAYQKTNDLDFGASVSYLRDVTPLGVISSVNYTTPETLSRLRLNGYFNARLGSSSVLDVTAGYTPQNRSQDYNAVQSNSSINNNSDGHDHIFNTAASLTTQIIPNLRNALHGDFNSYQTDASSDLLTAYTGGSQHITTDNTIKNHMVVAYDDLSYDLKFKNWTLSPAVNLSFRSYKDSTYTRINNYVNSTIQSYSGSALSVSQHIFLLTPAVNLYYKNLFNIQGGLLYSLGEHDTQGANVDGKKTFPFVTASADVAHLISGQSKVTVKGFISYSVNGIYADNANILPDLHNSSPSYFIPVPANVPSSYPGPTYGNIYSLQSAYMIQSKDQSFKTFSIGTAISPDKIPLTLSYFFEKNNYLVPVYYYVSYGTSYIISLIYPNTSMARHRIGLTYNLKGSSYSWQTGVNTAMETLNYHIDGNYLPLLGKKIWTGGWVNRFNFGPYIAGLDVLYKTGDQVAATGNATVLTDRVTSFSLQNVYAGYRFNINNHKLELFINARDLLQSKRQTITDYRSYYGGGFTFML